MDKLLKDIDKFIIDSCGIEALNMYKERPADFLFEFGVSLLENDKESDESDDECQEIAFQLFKEAAKLGLPEAMGNVGHCYFHGIGTDKDVDKAVWWFRKAAKLGEVESMKNLGNAYDMGYGVNQNSEQAFYWFNEAANHGDGRAMLELGVKYRNGEGVEKNIGKSKEWLESCINSDHSCKWLALLYMAETLSGGLLTDENPNRAKDLYESAYEGCREATDNGDAEAMIHLGNFFYYGNKLLEIDENPSKAVEWYEKAADAGSAQAKNMLGICYDNGKGVGKDASKACWWFEQASDDGFCYAKYNLANHYFLGVGVKKDFAKAAALYQQLGDSKIPYAQTLLGLCYLNGYGLDKDERKGVEWLRKAAGNGDSSAYGNLGSCYLEGRGINRDEHKAFSYFKEGAKLGDVYSIVNLAECYIEGTGTTADYKSAADILIQVCESESEEREFPNTALITAFEGWKAIEDPLHIVNAFTYAKAYYLLAHLYYSGNGVKKKDPSEAIRLLNVAENLGNEEALKLKNKILNEVSSDEVNNINKLNIEIELYDRPWGAGKAHKTGKYNIFLRRPDGSELPPLWFNTADAKFLYLVLLYSLKYKTPVQLQLFENKSIELANLARFLCVEPKNQSRHIDWIEGFDYSGESTRIDKSIGDGKKNEKLTPEEIKICQVFSKGQGKNKPWIKTLNFSKDQIIYPKSPELDSLFDKIFSKDNSYE